MSEIFHDLEKLGFSGLENTEIFSRGREKEVKKVEQGQKAELDPIELEKSTLFDKKHECPVCFKEFTSKAVRAGRTRLLKTDTDLRGVYYGCDPAKYDVVVCPFCGYAGAGKAFTGLTSMQRKLLKENIAQKFKGLPPSGEIYTYEDAILRYKLALYSSIVKKSRLSERAYLCLKLSWLYRGKREALNSSDPMYAKKAEELEKSEKEFTEKAYRGFEEAEANELFPICGMDENTYSYLLADLARRSGKIDASKKLLGIILASRTANNSVKDKARNLKELILEQEKAKEQ